MERLLDIFKNKNLIIALILISIVSAILFLNSVNNIIADDNSTIDNSKEVTVSNDKLDNGSVKFGDIGTINGDLDLSKRGE